MQRSFDIDCKELEELLELLEKVVALVPEEDPLSARSFRAAYRTRLFGSEGPVECISPQEDDLLWEFDSGDSLEEIVERLSRQVRRELLAGDSGQNEPMS